MLRWSGGLTQDSESSIDPTLRSENIDRIDDFEPVTPSELLYYSRLIIDSSSYKWLLQNIKAKCSLQWGEGETSETMHGIRHRILQKLSMGTIGKSGLPREFSAAFMLRLENYSTAGKLVLADVLVFTSSYNG
jgi:hypothetical protein